MNLGSMLDKIVDYNKVLAEAGFKRNGDGIKPWSGRYTNSNGIHIDIRGSDWTAYPSKITGETVDDLKNYLNQ